MVEIIRQLTQHSMVRYLLTGGGLFCIDLACFYICFEMLNFSIEVSQVISRSIGAFVGFFGHKFYSFKNSNAPTDGIPNISDQGFGYLMVTVFNILFSPLVVSYCMHVIQDNILLSKIVAEVFLVLETYILLRFIFTPRRSS